jgi:hypothetical protein
MKMSDAINAAANSHVRAFPLSRCSKGCILAQLKEYYDNTCPTVKVVNKSGQDVNLGTGNDGDR